MELLERFMESIMKNGLSPQSRQYVHLSKDVETAQNVGKRHDDKPYILRIDSLRAWNDGICAEDNHRCDRK